ncbi:RnfABCDGE type electron transport complex subunit D [Hoeflea alexandrii]|uniref:RnfABCDGE type electron transport complex subunit D n=1 Tax=Hoeflea alexandrii TaxID=288436 RepID=UPI0022AF4A51|nr:RnfABCDGE type electron transport complex subunit D [Hoeflea alexandrii]MCZ4291822.1 RnfABCDGE type electron transport complex subunit D [Hoeflea alexandrii]
MTGWLLDSHLMQQRSGWTPARVTLAQLVALVVPMGVSLAERGSAQIAVLVTASITCLVWELAFDLIRGRSLSFHTVTTALIVSVLVPATVPLWQIAMAASFGVVFGELVFGGRGYGIVSAAAAAAGFLVFSFAGAGLSEPSESMALATLPGAVLLLWGGLISWRVLASAAAALIAAELTRQGASGLPTVLATAPFGLVFLVSDPVAAASTQWGRWVYGVLAGLLIVLFDTLAGSAIAPAAIVFASLLASLFAPLIDHVTVTLIVGRRGRRHG